MGRRAYLSITGNVNLVKEWLNLKMTVSLPIANNLPIIGLLIGQPLLAGAIYIFDKVVGKTFMKFASVRYVVRGPITSPDIVLEKNVKKELHEEKPSDSREKVDHHAQDQKS